MPSNVSARALAGHARWGNKNLDTNLDWPQLIVRPCDECGANRYNGAVSADVFLITQSREFRKISNNPRRDSPISKVALARMRDSDRYWRIANSALQERMNF